MKFVPTDRDRRFEHYSVRHSHSGDILLILVAQPNYGAQQTNAKDPSLEILDLDVVVAAQKLAVANQDSTQKIGYFPRQSKGGYSGAEPKGPISRPSEYVNPSVAHQATDDEQPD